jgi:hypothetical protein
MLFVLLFFLQMKDINVPGTVQFVEMMGDRLCVGYPSSFAIYSVQGDAAPMSMCLFFLFIYCRINKKKREK